MQLEDIKTQLLATKDETEAFLAQIHKFYIQEIRIDEKLLEIALSELHNSGDIDFIELVKRLDKSPSKNDFFTILHAFENALPLLEAKVEDILHSLVHLTQQSGRDLATGGVYEAFQQFCSKEVNRPRESIEVILNQKELKAYASFLSCSLLAFHHDYLTDAIQYIESLSTHENERVRSQAYFSLGRLKIDINQTNSVWNVFSAKADIEKNANCCASMLNAIITFGDSFPSYWPQIENLLATFIETVSSEVQLEISHILAFKRVEIPTSTHTLFIEKLVNVSPDHTGIVNNIDHILVNLAKKELTHLAITLLESTLSSGSNITSLDYFARNLMDKHKELLNHIVTKWFLSADPILCNEIANLLHDITGKDINLKADLSLLTDDKSKLFVSYKALGWLFTRPIAVTSFVLSIFSDVSKNTSEDIEKILYDPLLLSYPGELKQFLQLCIENKNNSHLCERLLDKLQSYHDSIEKVSELKELMAPTKNISTYRKEFNKEMNKAREEAERSSLASLFTTQKLLYGNSSIYYMHKSNGEDVRQEMKMQSISHSAEMPRLNILDPENLDYKLRIFRYGRMNDEANS